MKEIYKSHIWNEVIDSLLLQKGIDITVDQSKWDLDTPGYTDVYEIWKKANFNSNSIKWINYYPGKHYDQHIVDDLANYLRVKTIRSWISRIDPGYFAPWHWDIDDKEKEYLSKGTLSRFSCFIEPPSMGHIFILGDQYYFNMPQGTLIKWNDYKEWHCGINGGLTPKFMFHLLAYSS
jgi:hypothetical protein